MCASEGEQYSILSLFEADGHYHANIGPEYLHRVRMPARGQTFAPGTLAFDNAGYARIEPGVRLVCSPEGGRS